ncbi:MAG: hypothetical protein ABI867_43140 [Kofleriaceae bacterium]
MRAFIRIDLEVHELHGPLAKSLDCVAAHLPGATRDTLERLARLDRERTPGEHPFSCLELLELVAAAHGLLADPPVAVRKARRVPEGPMPAADRIGELCSWLRERRRHGDAVYDLYSSTSSK